MIKGNIRLYDTEVEYLAEKDGLELPNVSFVEDSKIVFYNPFVKNDYLKLKYNVTSTSEATPLISDGKIDDNKLIDYVEELIIDGENITPVIEYKFNEIGEHEVWFKFTEDALNYNNDNGPFVTGFGDHNIVEVIEIPTDLLHLTNSIFYECSNLAKINLYTPNGKLHAISNSAFSNTNINELIIPNSVEIITNSAFSSCEELSKIIFIQNGKLKTIQNGAFASCTGLTKLVIPNSVTEINGAAFSGCTGLIEITSLATTAPTLTSGSFYGVAPNGTLYVPYGCTNAYSAWLGDTELGGYGWTIQELPQE